MSLADLDATLLRLSSAAAQIRANLLALEGDPTRELLGITVLEGTTAARWTETERDWADLWRSCQALDVVLEDARTLRGTRPWLSPDKEDRLGRLLTGASIDVSQTAVPILDRSLLGGSQTIIRCTPDELLDRMAEQFDRMRALLAAATTAWDDLVPRVSAARATLDGLATPAPGLDTEGASELARLQAQVDALGSTLIADPLSVAPSDLGAVEAEIDAMHRRVEAVTALRAESSERLAAARASLEEARLLVDAAITQHAETTAKVAGAVPAPAPLPGDLVDDLTGIERLVERGEWPAAQHALAAWAERIDAAIEQARADASAGRAPLELRHELRGRLDAYQAMARRRGLLEDREVSSLYDAAHRALFTAPTDLADAEALVRRYQQAVSPTRPSEGPRE